VLLCDWKEGLLKVEGKGGTTEQPSARTRHMRGIPPTQAWEDKTRQLSEELPNV